MDGQEEAVSPFPSLLESRRLLSPEAQQETEDEPDSEEEAGPEDDAVDEEESESTERTTSWRRRLRASIRRRRSEVVDEVDPDQEQPAAVLSPVPRSRLAAPRDERPAAESPVVDSVERAETPTVEAETPRVEARYRSMPEPTREPASDDHVTVPIQQVRSPVWRTGEDRRNASRPVARFRGPAVGGGQNTRTDVES
ncbi:MAG TPA: hypothetical protein H9881_09295 [Candidatus Stackebrandtia excrementipullorum]|nr:hypothetical protein [Candidatus Stackebrandtia excrementipullorum]